MIFFKSVASTSCKSTSNLHDLYIFQSTSRFNLKLQLLFIRHGFFYLERVTSPFQTFMDFMFQQVKTAPEQPQTRVAFIFVT